MQEVIFLFGPPFSGKTSYYEQHLKTSHERVSASELYQANPSWGLRRFILHVLKLLNEGKGVVIDDENWSRKTRTSCIESIRAKVPACKFTCYVFKPKDAFECLWRREWVLAQHFLSREENRPNCQSTPSVELDDSEARIQMWFRRESGDHVSGIDAVEESEGWHQIKEIKTSLQPKTNYKFEVPAAFLDWRSLVDQSIDDLAEALMTWKNNTVCGRVIVLATITDEDSNDKDSEDSNPGDIYKSILEKIKSKTQILARKLSVPVFYIIIKDQGESGSFTKSLKPGILSFLQRLHHIDLQHPRTVYIYHSKGSRVTDYAQTGLKQFAADLVCRDPNILAHCQGARTSSSTHESITDFDYIPESKGFISSFVPFCNRIASDDNEDDVKGTYIAEERWGRVLGVSFKDTETLISFQEDYAFNASHISAEGSKMGQKPLQGVAKRGSHSLQIESSDLRPQCNRQDPSSDRAETSRSTKLPAWMTPKRRKSQEEIKDDKTGTDNKYAGLPSTMYCVTVAELREVAKLFLDQEEDSDESSSSFPESSELSESRVTKDNEDIDPSNTDVNLEMEEMNSEGERPGDDERDASREDGDDRDKRKERPESGRGEDGVANIITDLFSGESERKRPPPKKKTGRTPFTSSSLALPWSDESPWQPDTISTASKGNSRHEEPSVRKPPVQDFSFLDEIF